MRFARRSPQPVSATTTPAACAAHPSRRGLLAAGATLAFTPWLLQCRVALAAPQIVAAAPAFSVADSHGRTRTLQEFQGKLVVLEWTNHECPFVRKHYGGHMQGLQREATAAGAVWLSVVSSAPGEQGHVQGEQANALTASRNAAPSAVLLDPRGTMGRAYGALTTPHLYIVSTDGRLLYAGGIDSIPSANPADIARATPVFRNALQEAIAGKPVTVATSRPYGCAVKYGSAA
jgi:peroxiredoxin